MPSRTTSSGALTLKNGSWGTCGHSTRATLKWSVNASILRRSYSTTARRSSAARSTGHSANTGWVWPPDAAMPMRAPSAVTAAISFSPKSDGNSGVSAAAVSSHRAPRPAAHSSAVRMPTSGPP